MEGGKGDGGFRREGGNHDHSFHLDDVGDEGDYGERVMRKEEEGMVELQQHLLSTRKRGDTLGEQECVEYHDDSDDAEEEKEEEEECDDEKENGEDNAPLRMMRASKSKKRTKKKKKYDRCCTCLPSTGTYPDLTSPWVHLDLAVTASIAGLLAGVCGVAGPPWMMYVSCGVIDERLRMDG